VITPAMAMCFEEHQQGRKTDNNLLFIKLQKALLNNSFLQFFIEISKI
jgi:hypothetical protein